MRTLAHYSLRAVAGALLTVLAAGGFIAHCVAGAWKKSSGLSDWLPICSAPEGAIVNVVGRYKTATAGFPRYAMLVDGKWLEFSQHEPEELVCWAWRPRDSWPQEGWTLESHRPEEDTTHE